MTTAYPCKLPLPLVSGFSFSDQELTVFNELDSGPPVARLKSDEGYSMFDARFSFNQLEMQVFRSWFRNTIKHGSKTFTIGLNIDGGTTEHTCYMRNPQYTLNAKRWQVSTKLISLQFKELNDCDTESLTNAFNGFESLSKNLAQLEDVTENGL